MELIINDISLNRLDKELDKELEKEKKEKSDKCQELKNIAYKTMLLNGTDIIPKQDNHTNNDKIANFLENESSANKNETWSKLNKTQRILRLDTYVIILKAKHNLNDNESNNLKTYLHRCVERKNLSKTKEVIYNKEKNIIENIPLLIFNEDTRHFILKKDDKHVSTVKSLPPDKKSKAKTIKIHDE